MTTPDGLADALYESHYGEDGYTFSVVVSAAELRTLAQASAKIGWDEGERHESEYLNMWGQFCPNPVNPYAEENKQ